jgi:hypothetical protein
MKMTAKANTVEQAIDLTAVNQEVEIWIGYTKHGRNYLGKQTKAINTEQQIIHLIEYYKLNFCSTERIVSRWLCCQRPIVQICEISTVGRSRDICWHNTLFDHT